MSAPADPEYFRDRTVIVSGGAGTLGKVISTALAAAGANVVINDVKKDALEELVTKLRAGGHSVLAISEPATSGSDIVAQTIQEFGSLHAIINATLGPIPWKPFEKLTDNDLRSQFEANVLGPLNLARAAWPHFKQQNFGRIVNFTSDSMLGLPPGAAYTMSKGALFGINETMAMEGAAHNIRINCIQPVAYKPHMEPYLETLSEDVRHVFRTMHSPEANVPMILALVSEKCEVSGQVFNTAGWSAARTFYGYVKGETELRTVEDCLKAIDTLSQ